MRGSGKGASHLRVAAGVLAVAAAYLAAGAVGKLLVTPAGYRPAVWPAAGIAVAAVLLGGYRVAVGVFLGAFASRLIFAPGPPVLVSAAVAFGAPLQACVAVFLVRRFVVAPTALDEARDVGLFLLLAGPLACVIAATVGVSTLYAAGTIDVADAPLRWVAWWAGDTTGAILVGPLLIVSLSRSRQVPGRRLWVTVPMGLASALVLVLFVRVNHGELIRVESTLRRHADAVTAGLERGSDHYLQVVQSIADYHHAAGRVDRGAFELFVKGALARDPGIRALGWIPRVSAGERAGYEEAAQREREHPFIFTEPAPAGQLRLAAFRDEHYPLYYVEPAHDNQSLLGLDLASDPRWRAALDDAAKNGQASASIDETLLGRGAPVFAVLAPVFAAAPAGQPQSSDRPVGFAVGICSLSALTDAALRLGPSGGADLVVHEPSDAWGGPRTFTTRPAALAGGGDMRRFTTHPRIALRSWTMEFVADVRSVGAGRSWQAWLVLASGSLFVAWLGAFLLMITGRTSKVENLVAQRTRELEVSNNAVEEQRAELATSNTELAAALNAKEILLRELHHRVKNNLQVIASLFSLQARYLPDPRYREIFEESRNRVFSIALAHEKLYRSKDLNRIDFSEYARNLVGHLHSMLGADNGVNLVTDIQEVTLPVETAIPCGLVINELVTNAFKHAFPAGRRGAIQVVLREVDTSRWLVAVEDDGVGLPAEIALGKTDSLGLDLVSILAAQIGAEVEVTREGGTRFQLTFGSGRRRADAA
jgi:two-component sensor histidine kinase/CHASE1-domain containing sensor protein